MSPASAQGETCNGQLATIVGTNDDDLLTGTEGVDVIVALDGDDEIFGLGGEDVINNPRIDVIGMRDRRHVRHTLHPVEL